MKLLLQGAEIGSRNTTDWTTLKCASRYGHASVVQHLWAEKGKDEIVRDGRSTLEPAIHGDHIDVVRFFYDVSVDFKPDIEDSDF